MNSRLLDLVTKTQDGYTLDNRISKEKFVELCAVLGKHGYRYAGKGMFKEVGSEVNIFQDPKWWKQHVKSGDWIRLKVDFFPISSIREVLRIEDDKIVISALVESDLTIFYGEIKEVLEIRRAADRMQQGPLRKLPTRPRRP